ncbi:MAG: dihydrodipicolinate synthase family protein [Acidimicrobiales bacterium]
MAPEPVFKGVGVALVTLFGQDGQLDAPATAELAGRLAQLGVKAVLVAGTTGEAAALEMGERSEILAAVRKVLPDSGEVALLAGTGAPWGGQAARLTAAAVDAGADAVLALSPLGAVDPRPYYDKVARAAGGVPVLAYHLPTVSPPGVAVDVLADLPVAGLKDSSGDAGRLLATVEGWDRPVYVGSSALVAMAGSIGCAGAILALANAEPEKCAAAFAGSARAQLELAKPRVAEANFPGGVKGLVAARFGYSPVARLGTS